MIGLFRWARSSPDGLMDVVQKKLAEYGFTSSEDLDQYLNKIDKSLTRARNKDLGIVEDDNKVSLVIPVAPGMLPANLRLLSPPRRSQPSRSSTSPTTPSTKPTSKRSAANA